MECHACGAEISEKAADCPQCGASVRDISGSADDGVTGESDTTADGTGTGNGDAGSGRVDDGQSGPTVPGAAPSNTTAHESSSASDANGGDTGSDAGPEDTGADTSPEDTGAYTSPEDTGGDTGAEEETGWEAAGPPPEDQETMVDREPGTAGQGSDGSSQEQTGADSEPGSDRQGPTVPGGDGSTDPGSSSSEVRGSEAGGRAGFGTETGAETATGGPEAGTGTGGDETVDATGEEATAEEAGIAGIDPMDQVKSLPFLSAPLAGVVTAVVLAVVSTVVGVLVPNTGSDTVAVGTTVLFDLHFATDGHLPVGLLTQFDTARPPDATLGILYLLPPLFLYTAAKFVTAYNVEEDTLTPVAGVGGVLVAVGYFPAMLVAFVLAPGGPFSPVKLLPAVLLAAVVYPVLFGGIGGLVAGALSGSERRIGTLYGVVGFFLIVVGSFVLTIPAIELSDVGLLPQIHASLFTVVAVNGLRLGNPDVGVLVLLAYPMVALVVFAAGALRAWNAEDVAGPLRGIAKGLSPVPTYFTLLGLLATILPLLADPWIARELGLSANGEALVGFLVQTKLFTIGQYVTAVFVGTLVYAVFLGGFGGLLAGTARYVLSDEE